MDPDQRQVLAARREARGLGYLLAVRQALHVEPLTHMTFAAVPGSPSPGSFLAFGRSPGEAAQAGLEILQRMLPRALTAEPPDTHT